MPSAMNVGIIFRPNPSSDRIALLLVVALAARDEGVVHMALSVATIMTSLHEIVVVEA